MRLLVIGAAGMLGQDLLAAAREAGHEPIGLDLPEIGGHELDRAERGGLAGRLERLVLEALLALLGRGLHRDRAGARDRPVRNRRRQGDVLVALDRAVLEEVMRQKKIAPLLGEAVKRIADETSVSSLFD